DLRVGDARVAGGLNEGDPQPDGDVVVEEGVLEPSGLAVDVDARDRLAVQAAVDVVEVVVGAQDAGLRPRSFVVRYRDRAELRDGEVGGLAGRGGAPQPGRGRRRPRE